ncbi:MAG: hypothetical protein L3J02_00715 [Henriciella sp.]|nr:hypothetical protein [Henriciella sp.]
MADGSALAAIPLAEQASLKREARGKSQSKARAKVRKFKVDFWATDFNTAEIGIMKRTQNEAASDQFTKDMEIYGQTVIDGERTSLLAFRKEIWKKNKDFKRRLIIKLFSENLHWRGTIEMLIGRSMQLTLAAGGRAVPAYSINLGRHSQLIQLERSAHRWPLFPEVFSFFILTDNGPRFYKLRRNLICFGSDFTLYSQKGRKIGQLDSKLINLGGAWKIKLNADHANAKLEAVLQLFCAMLKFNRPARRHVGRLAQKVQLGRLLPDLDRHEEDLYQNPRHRR